jgi:hypothetical protein
MKLPRRNFLHLAAGTAALPALSRIARAQAYPTRPVRVIVPFAPAGTTDIAARLMGQWLSERLGQQFVIENRPGASTTIGTEVVVRAPADGYTLLLVGTASAINTTLFESRLNYNFLRDIVPIAGMFRVPNVMVCIIGSRQDRSRVYRLCQGKPGQDQRRVARRRDLKSLGWRTVQVDDWRRHGSYSVSRQRARANRSSRRTGAGRFRHHACLDRVHQGGQAARACGVHGHALARAAGPSDRREFVPGYESSGYFGFGAPARTPAGIIDKLNKEINAGLADPKLKTQLADLGGIILGGSSADFRTLITEETEKWGKVIRAANIKPE